MLKTTDVKLFINNLITKICLLALVSGTTLLSTESLSQAAGQYTNCIAISSGGDRFNVQNGNDKTSCHVLGRKCAGEKATTTYFTSALVINAPYMLCTKTITQIKSPSTQVVNIFEFPKHLRWVLDHENARGRVQHYANVNDLSAIRNIYYESQDHNKKVQALITKVSDKLLVDTLENLGITSQPYDIDPSLIPLVGHMDWVVDNQGQRRSFEQLLDMSDYNKIRETYLLAQSHNPQYADLIGSVSNSELIEVLGALGIYQNVDYLPEPVKPENSTYEDISWCIWHEGVMSFTSDGLKYRKPELIRKKCSELQSNNQSARVRVNNASDEEIFYVMQGTQKHFQQNNELKKHVRWVMNHKGQKQALIDAAQANDYQKILSIYAHNQKHNMDVKHRLVSLSLEDIKWFLE